MVVARDWWSGGMGKLISIGLKFQEEEELGRRTEKTQREVLLTLRRSFKGGDSALKKSNKGRTKQTPLCLVEHERR